MATFRHLSISDHDGVTVVTFDRPPVNAVNQQLYREIAGASAADGPIARTSSVVVATGAGPHFCAGNDLH